MSLPRTFRREQILNAGLRFAREKGFTAITCKGVGEAAECSYNTVRRQWSNREKLAAAIRDHAKKTGDFSLYVAGCRATGVEPS